MADQPKKVHFNVLGTNKQAPANAKSSDEGKLNQELNNAFGLADQDIKESNIAAGKSELNAAINNVTNIPTTPEIPSTAPVQSGPQMQQPVPEPLIDNNAVAQMAAGSQQQVQESSQNNMQQPLQPQPAVPQPVSAESNSVGISTDNTINPDAPQNHEYMPQMQDTFQPTQQQPVAVQQNNFMPENNDYMATTPMVTTQPTSPQTNFQQSVQVPKKAKKGFFSNKLIIIIIAIVVVLGGVGGTLGYLSSTGALDDMINGKNSENNKKAYIGQVDEIMKNIDSDWTSVASELTSSKSDIKDLEGMVQNIENVSKKVDGYKEQINGLDTPDDYNELKNGCITLLDEASNFYTTTAKVYQEIIDGALSGSIRSTSEIKKKLAPLYTAAARFENAIDTYNMIAVDYGLSLLTLASSYGYDF